MANFNRVILAGNLTRDPEMRYTPKGTALAKFGLAINRKWKSETGELKEETTFVDVEAWSGPAETIGKYLKKGRPIMLEGRLRYDSWDDKQTNQKRSRLVVVLETFQFLDSGRTDAGASGASSTRTAAAPAAAAASSPAPEPAEPDSSPAEADDVPF